MHDNDTQEALRLARKQLAETKALRRKVESLRTAVEAADRANRKGALDVVAGVNGVAGNGHRRGKRGPR